VAALSHAQQNRSNAGSTAASGQERAHLKVYDKDPRLFKKRKHLLELSRELAGQLRWQTIQDITQVSVPRHTVDVRDFAPKYLRPPACGTRAPPHDQQGRPPLRSEAFRLQARPASAQLSPASVRVDLRCILEAMEPRRKIKIP